MTFTYTVADLTSSTAATANRAKVRLAIGDTTSAGHLLEDEEIAIVLADHTDEIPLSALRCAELALAKLQKSVDVDGAGIHVGRSARWLQMKDLIVELERKTLGNVELTLTGTISDLETIALDTNRNPPVFAVGWGRNK